MKLKAVLMCLLLSAACFQANATKNSDEDMIINYLQTRNNTSPEASTKAIYLTMAMGEIFLENWKNSKKEFEDISKNIELTDACLIHACIGQGKHCLDIIDEIQAFLTNTNQKAQLFSEFMYRFTKRPQDSSNLPSDLCDQLK
ncbi:hypothetical protein [Photobacterium kishitanii]|uniref:Uncharacterized protein n=1 Tax=Photobacterium kishitanii TaxID=318456 RepID=A0A2T3KM89_9GAMM|nr:hypothetical protein [Photobacterium kishitanii]PSV00892.1 hypothetical protein C9J27_02375 [Photobacterium kishitanii]